MALRAVSLRSVDVSGETAPRILRASHSLQMARVYARAVPTKMVEDKSVLRYRPDKQFVRDMVCEPTPPTDSNDPITIMKSGQPLPARSSVDFPNLRPEPLLESPHAPSHPPSIARSDPAAGSGTSVAAIQRSRAAIGESVSTSTPAARTRVSLTGSHWMPP